MRVNDTKLARWLRLPRLHYLHFWHAEIQNLEICRSQIRVVCQQFVYHRYEER
jgi:hypothetical protein